MPLSASRFDVWTVPGVNPEGPSRDDAAMSGAARSNTSDAYARPRLLVVGPLPPPVGGVETVTGAVLESFCFADFDVAHCDLTKGRPKSTQGKFDLGNLRWALIHFGRMRRSLREFRPDVVYMPTYEHLVGLLEKRVPRQTEQASRCQACRPCAWRLVRSAD